MIKMASLRRRFFSSLSCDKILTEIPVVAMQFDRCFFTEDRSDVRCSLIRK